MRKCISIVFSAMRKLWRTLCSTFVKKHLYKQDVDADGIEEIVLDLNGHQENHSNSHINENINNKEDK